MIQIFKNISLKIYGTLIFSVTRFVVILLLSFQLESSEFVRYTAILGLIILAQWILVSPVCISIQREQCQKRHLNQEAKYLYPQLIFILICSMIISLAVFGYLNNYSLLFPVAIYSLGELFIGAFKVFYNYEERYKDLNKFILSTEFPKLLFIIVLIIFDKLTTTTLLIGLGFIPTFIVLTFFLNYKIFVLRFKESLSTLKIYVVNYKTNLNLVILSLGSWFMWQFERFLTEHYNVSLVGFEYQLYYIVISVAFNFSALLGVIVTPKILSLDEGMNYLTNKIIPILIIVGYAFLALSNVYQSLYLLMTLSVILAIIFGILQVFLLSLRKEKLWLLLIFIPLVGINEIFRWTSDFGFEMIFRLSAIKIITMSFIYIYIILYEKNKNY